MVKLLLFDAFLTLFNTEGTHLKATRLILESSGAQPCAPTLDPDEFHSQWDKFIVQEWRAEDGFKLLCDIFKDTLIKTFEYFGVKNNRADDVVKIWLDLIADSPPYPEVEQIVNPLTERYDTAIVSNADNYEMNLCLRRLTFTFPAVFTSEDVRVYKPRPEIFHAAMKHFGTAPHETLMIGDSLAADVEGAHNAGIRCVWINRTGKILTPDHPQPDFILPDLNKLNKLLDSIQ
ncbi:MAG: HAD family hydrolase [bacterium]